MDSNSERKWDESTVLKEEVDTFCTSKRERTKEYSFNHRANFWCNYELIYIDSTNQNDIEFHSPPLHQTSTPHRMKTC
ncbi:hypothetical protein JHK82_048578 [Glycine max]|nr:hypothetical protein JHK82_048578 [Glycine max]